MQQRPNQRLQLEETLSRLELRLRLVQRRIISTQVQIELLNQRERNIGVLENIERNHQIYTAPQDNTISSSNNSTSESDQDNNDNNDNLSSTDQSSNDSDSSSEEPDPLLLDGHRLDNGDKVIIRNPFNENESEGVILGHTPKRYRIRLTNGDVILRQPDNLDRIIG
jgi:hypothetical protein